MVSYLQLYRYTFVYKCNYDQKTLNNNTLSIFPNPGFGEYTLLDVNRTLAYPLNIEIYSLQGAIIQSNPMYNSIHRLNLDAASGLYFVNVIDQKGKQIRFKLIHK